MLSTQQIKYLENLFTFYNQELFSNKLPDIIFVMSRDKKMSGEFSSDQWKDQAGKTIHEITINPDYFDAYNIDFHQTLVHEMCHLYQYEFGTPGKSGYHNLEFSKIMENVGLQTSDSGTPDGLRTGRRMSDFFLEDGLFINAFKKIQETSFEIPKYRAERTVKKRFGGVRSKYTCNCGTNIWGKSGLKISCRNCEGIFIEK
jgi:hypothetical protein